jgi:hypothetical protein
METLMMIKTLTTAAIVAALSSPVFAQDQAPPQKPMHALRHYRGTYDQLQEPAIIAPRAPTAGSYFDHDSFDPSRIGDHNPNFNPPS